MAIGSITSHVDLPQAAIVLFFIGFVGVCWFLRRLDQKEGYPLQPATFLARPTPVPSVVPLPEVYRLNEGGTTVAPHNYPPPPMRAHALYAFDGSPLTPEGNPLLAAIGPGAWVMRRDDPMLTEEGEPMLAPLRAADGWSVEAGESDPRGMVVLDRRYVRVGVVDDLWVDRSIKILRMLEVTLRDGLGAERILVPIFHTVIDERAREVRITALEAHQLADLPMPRAPDVITAREDDRLNAYFAAGYFYRDTEATARPAGFRP